MEKDIVLLTDSYYPENNSAAIQLNDLSNYFTSNNINVFVFAPENKSLIETTVSKHLHIFRVKSINPKKCRNYLTRLIAEIALPFFYYIHYLRVRKSISKNFSLIVYSPSIFLYLFIHLINKKNICSYLILRDLFPYWAKDAGIIKNKLIFKVFDYIARKQISSFNMVGCQSDADVNFVKNINPNVHKLNNWLSKNTDLKSNDLGKLESFFKNSAPNILTYTGNVGPAQNIDRLLELSKYFSKSSLDFLIIGEGSEFDRLQTKAKNLSLENVTFFPSVAHHLLKDVYERSDIGFVSLNKKIKFNNVPGKFLNYLSNELPVLCDSGDNAELESYFYNYNIGSFVSSDSIYDLKIALDKILERNNFNLNKCFDENFSTLKAGQQIMDFLK